MKILSTILGMIIAFGTLYILAYAALTFYDIIAKILMKMIGRWD